MAHGLLLCRPAALQAIGPVLGSLLGSLLGALLGALLGTLLCELLGWLLVVFAGLVARSVA